MKRAALIATALLLVAALAGPASGRVTYDVTTTVEYELEGPGAGFYGQVSSPAEKCVPNRRIEAFRARRGPDVLIDDTRSTKMEPDHHPAGEWHIEHRDGYGKRFYIQVPAERRGGDRCHAYRSPFIRP